MDTKQVGQQTNVWLQIVIGSIKKKISEQWKKYRRRHSLSRVFQKGRFDSLSPIQDIPYFPLLPNLFSPIVLTTFTQYIFYFIILFYLFYLSVFTHLNANFMKAGICSTYLHIGINIYSISMNAWMHEWMIDAPLPPPSLFSEKGVIIKNTGKCDYFSIQNYR